MNLISRADAKAQGLAFYRTGKSCTNGHEADRRTSNGRCTTCELEQSKAWRDSNPEKFAAIRAKYQTGATYANRMERDAEKLAQKKREWYLRNADQVKEYAKAHRLKNLKRKRDQDKAYREANKERIKVLFAEWKKNNHAALIASIKARKAAKLKATPAWTEREAIERIYATAAFMTKTTGIQHHVDHIVPLRGKTVCGLHVAANLQVLEASENISKGNRHWPDMWETAHG